MSDDVFAVFYKDEHDSVRRLLIVLDNLEPFHCNGGAILDWYAETYAFDRSKLTGGFVGKVSYQK